MWCSTGAEPITVSMTLGLVAKKPKSRKKGAKNLGQFHLPDRTYNLLVCLGEDPDLTWDLDAFLHN